jgi:hypothetical protein
MKTKINLIKALAATVLLTFGFSKASAKVEQIANPNHKTESHAEMVPCDPCVMPCMDVS